MNQTLALQHVSYLWDDAKAAELHMSRLLAAELGADKICVNTVNPNAVLRGSKIWEGDWAACWARAYGITVTLAASKPPGQSHISTT